MNSAMSQKRSLNRGQTAGLTRVLLREAVAPGKVKIHLPEQVTHSKEVARGAKRAEIQGDSVSGMARQTAAQLEILSGWKEIANYLRKGVRTVQRYECELGLPIRRPSGKSVGSVFATKAEIDAWVSARPIREAFRLPLRVVDTAGAVKTLAEQTADLTRLREEAARLRNEIAASREELFRSREELFRSIELLHQSLRVILVEEGPRLVSSSRPTAELLAFNSKKKVN